MNRPPSGSLVFRLIMSAAERLSSKSHICTRSLALRPDINFLTISQQRALSADIPASQKGAYSLFNPPNKGVYLFLSLFKHQHVGAI